jgi:hypothetical protein
VQEVTHIPSAAILMPQYPPIILQHLNTTHDILGDRNYSINPIDFISKVNLLTFYSEEATSCNSSYLIYTWRTYIQGETRTSKAQDGEAMMHPLYDLKIDPQTATDLAEKGATVLMLGVPGELPISILNLEPLSCKCLI